jgi:hypothetical protein
VQESVHLKDPGGGGIGEFYIQIILQRIFMTKQYELKNIATFVSNI